MTTKSHFRSPYLHLNDQRLEVFSNNKRDKFNLQSRKDNLSLHRFLSHCLFLVFSRLFQLKTPMNDLTTIVLVTAACYTIYLAINRYKRLTWRKVGTVRSLFVHPVKSFRGIQVTEGTVSPIGLKSGDNADRWVCGYFGFRCGGGLAGISSGMITRFI